MTPGAEEAKLILEVVNYRPEPLPPEAIKTLKQMARQSPKEALRMKREQKCNKFCDEQREILGKTLLTITDANSREEGNSEFAKLINSLLPDLLATFNQHQNRIIFRSHYLTWMDARYSRFTAAPLPSFALKDPIRTAESLALTPGTASDLGDAIWAMASLHARGLTIRFRRCLVCGSIFYADDLRRRVCPPPKRCQQIHAQNQRHAPDSRKKRREYMRTYRGYSDKSLHETRTMLKRLKKSIFAGSKR
jgi:hypothetical protein